MQESNSSIQNLIKNLSSKQKIAIGVAILIIIIIVIAMTALLSNNSSNNKESGRDENSVEYEKGTSVSEGVKFTDSDDANQSESVTVPVNTKYNKNHTYALIDYLPVSNYDWIALQDGTQKVREYWNIRENSAIEKGIVVSVDNCNEEKNTISANEYLKSLPIDLSDYIVVYQTHAGSVPCDVE